MKLYIAHQGCYEDQYVAGIYSSPFLAMAVLPGKKWTKTTWTTYPNYPKLTNVSHWISWDNDLDWSDSVSITEIELTSDGPERKPDRSVIQTYRESDGGWDYIDVPDEDERE